MAVGATIECARTPPARISAATPMACKISAALVPWRRAQAACPRMRFGHCLTCATVTAMSGLDLPGSAPSAQTWQRSPWNACTVSGVGARRCSRHFGSAGRKGIRSTRLSSPFVWIGPQPNRFRSTSLFGPTATRLDESQRAEQFESCALPTRYVERGIPVRCSGRSAPPEPLKRLLMPGAVPKMAHNHNASLEPRGARSVGRNACYG